jgi:hypothetical protein
MLKEQYSKTLGNLIYTVLNRSIISVQVHGIGSKLIDTEQYQCKIFIYTILDLRAEINELLIYILLDNEWYYYNDNTHHKCKDMRISVDNHLDFMYSNYITNSKHATICIFYINIALDLIDNQDAKDYIKAIMFNILPKYGFGYTINTAKLSTIRRI